MAIDAWNERNRHDLRQYEKHFSASRSFRVLGLKLRVIVLACPPCERMSYETREIGAAERGKMAVLTLDGSHGEGGGQILRTALSLSTIAVQPASWKQP